MIWLLEMPLPKLRCNRDHMPKLIGSILFNSKWEQEKKIEKNRIERSWGLGERKRIRQRQRITTPVDAAVYIDPLLCGGGATKHRCQWANARSGICGTSPGGQVLHCVLQQTLHLLQHWITCIPLVQGLRNGCGALLGPLLAYETL